MLISILAAALIFAVLVIVHEAGHFAMAKRLGVRVLRFSIGYPPKLWGTRRGETEYSIGATPFGGYVRMLGDEVGENPKSEELANYLHEIGLDVIGDARAHSRIKPTSDFDQNLRTIAERLAFSPSDAATTIGRELRPDEAGLIDEINQRGSVEESIKFLTEHPPPVLLKSFQKRAFPTQSLGKRILIVLAGPLSNLLFAPVLLTVVFMVGVPLLLPVVGQVKPDLPAFKAGLRTGDRIISLNGQPTDSWNDFSRRIKEGDGTPFKVEIVRTDGAASSKQTIVVTPTKQEQKTIYGTMAATWVIGVLPRGDETRKRFGPLSAFGHGVTTSIDMAKQLVVGIASIVTGAIPVREALGGPIMIAQMAGREAHEGFSSLAMFTVMLSLELGIINLLPVPLLDGGHLLFFAFEGVLGRPLELRYREMMLQVGLFLLVALMAFVIFNDISRIVQG
ncbi:MAG: RIP metalloprotease RseP [Candidatus Binatus sp.]|uniref:RIP metalloprotease RseP n=1 Tax=Candidatus Binatus sp. TaxID=2811406 RepID=UPI0027287779|nr:RIP metalloprotease RseP [Candidatus Binatus sp.]MDO8433659.1 RIP metalloprotease RseP [Candidatus Binatus sp.]